MSSAGAVFTLFRVRDFGAAVHAGAGGRFDAITSLSRGSRIVNGVVGFGVEAGELVVAETAFVVVFPEPMGFVGPGV
jgi:hypothetical protein